MTNATSIRALVIDDEPLAREMIREMLESHPEAVFVGPLAEENRAGGADGRRDGIFRRTERRRDKR